MSARSHDRPGFRRSPVVSEGLLVLCIERAGGGEHDGGVEVGDDPGHGVGCCDAGLGTLVARLERREHQGHLRTHNMQFIIQISFSHASLLPSAGFSRGLNYAGSI